MNPSIRSAMRCAAILVLVGTSTQALRGEAPFPPQPFPPNFYNAMMKRSPFVLPSYEVEVAVETSGWAQNLRITSALLIAGNDVILVADSSSQDRFAVRNRPNALGIRLIELHRSEDPREVSAIIEKDGQQAAIRFDESILANLPVSVATDNPGLQSE